MGTREPPRISRGAAVELALNSLQAFEAQAVETLLSRPLLRGRELRCGNHECGAPPTTSSTLGEWQIKLRCTKNAQQSTRRGKVQVLSGTGAWVGAQALSCAGLPL